MFKNSPLASNATVRNVVKQNKTDRHSFKIFLLVSNKTKLIVGLSKIKMAYGRKNPKWKYANSNSNHTSFMSYFVSQYCVQCHYRTVMSF